jgi:hypothetical protein
MSSGTEYAQDDEEALTLLRRQIEANDIDQLISIAKGKNLGGVKQAIKVASQGLKKRQKERQQEAEEIWHLAQIGVQTPTSPLPYADYLQQLFGHHDISGIQAHLGLQATASARAMHARAYATQHHVVFADQPDLYTIAHEAAHIVQQRRCMQIAGGIGQADDVYEQHADAVARLVVAGKSAEGLLDEFARTQGELSETDRHDSPRYRKIIQRRIITLAAENALLAIPENSDAYRWTVVRTLKALHASDLNALLAYTHILNLQALQTQVSANALNTVTPWVAYMRTQFPHVVYPGPDRTYALPIPGAEENRFNRTINWSLEVLKRIGNGEADVAINDVFCDGGPLPYTIADIRSRFTGAYNKLTSLVQRKRVFTDMTGAREEMDIGADTQFDNPPAHEGSIRMKKSFLAGVDDGKEDGITLMHESFHAAFADIKDAGGYPTSSGAFKRRLPAVKYTNAAHYEEVIRRYTDANPVGGTFIPENAPHATPPTSLDEAIGYATDRLQTAWERAQNIYGLAFHQWKYHQPALNQPLVYCSSLLKMTIHSRIAGIAGGAAVDVNDIDFASAESATRLITLTNREINENLLTSSEKAYRDVAALTEILIRRAINRIGPITGDENRDYQMIIVLAAFPADVSTIVTSPVAW